MISTDVFFHIIENSDFRTITKLCQINSAFYNLCKTYPKQIEHIKCKGLKKFINENDYKIRKFALNNRYIFDEQSSIECEQTKNPTSVIIGTHYDKIWIDLMFFLNEHYYTEAEALIICNKLPNPPMGLFEQYTMVKMPPKIMILLWQQLGNILDVAGYENKEDFLEDYRENAIKIHNKTMRKIIKNQLR